MLGFSDHVAIVGFSDRKLVFFDQVGILRPDVVFFRLAVGFSRPQVVFLRPASWGSSTRCCYCSTKNQCNYLVYNKFRLP